METERIDVLDENGNRTQVVAVYSSISTGNFDRPGQLRGMATLRTLTGDTITADGDEYVVLRTGQRFRRI